MPTVFTHVVAAGAATQLFAPRELRNRVLFFSVLASILPDIDVLGFYFGIRYEDTLGHRGFFHSFAFALLLAVFIVSTFFRRFSVFSRTWILWVLYFFCVTASHGILDGFTNGGLGIAYFSPFDDTRYFLPWRPILVSPIGVTGFLTAYGAKVLLAEILVVWVPIGIVLFCVRQARKAPNPKR